ncbi:MAG: hypothetical protein AB8F65_10000 [Woeseiaceae bacterium]
MSKLFDKMKRLIDRDSDQSDIAPPDMKIPTGTPGVRRPVSPNGQQSVQSLRGSVTSKNDHETTLNSPLDKTEELLTLSEEDFRATEGFNPYDSNTFQATTTWDELKRR